jgi:hypothetical protein
MESPGLSLVAIALLLAACAGADLNAPVPVVDSGVDPEAWVLIHAGPFLSGQHNDPHTIDYDYEMMVTDVTVGQYTAFLNESLTQSSLRVEGAHVVGFYPGDEFRAAKHGLEIAAGEYLLVVG